MGLSGLSQELKVIEGSDGTEIHYSTFGQAPPVAIVANWLNHLVFDWNSPVCGRWWKELAREHRVIRYHQRGCSLSGRDTSDLSFEASAGDLEYLITALGFDRFALLGASRVGKTVVNNFCRETRDSPEHGWMGSHARTRQWS